LGTLVGFEGFAGQNNRLISIFLAFYILFLRFPAKNKYVNFDMVKTFKTYQRPLVTCVPLCIARYGKTHLWLY